MKERRWIETGSNCCKVRGFVIYLFIILKFCLGSRFGSADTFGTVHHPMCKIKTQIQSSWRGIRPCP